MMPSKLYVSNLSQAATLSGIRQLFGTCGEVVQVEFVAERNSRARPSAAHVTMATDAGAEKALSVLHGRLHGDRTMMITRSPDRTDDAYDGAPRPKERAEEKKASVVIAQQYRDRLGLGYDLDCRGLHVTFRFIFPPEGAQDWQLEARIGSEQAPVAVASAKTRAEALQGVKQSWPGASLQSSVPELDWAAVEAVLRSVKAL